MTVVVLLLSVIMIALGAQCARFTWRWRRAPPKLGGPDRDVQTAKYCVAGIASFFAAMGFALVVISPKYLHATHTVAAHTSSVLVLIGMAGFLACYLIGSRSLILMLWVGPMLLCRKITRPKAP